MIEVAGHKTSRVSLFGKKSGLRGVNITKMSMSEWVAFRTASFKVGGSDVGTVMGLNSYTDPMTLWFEKIGLKKKHFAGNVFTATGHLYEDIIMRQAEYYDDTGEWWSNFYSDTKFRKIKAVPYTLFHNDMPYFGLNLDGRVVHDDKYTPMFGKGVWECKTIGGYYCDKFECGYPEKYNCQVQAYMMMTGCEYAILTLVRDGRHVIQRVVLEDPEYQAKIHSTCSQFHEAMMYGKEIVDSDLSLNDKYDNVYSLQQSYSHILEVSADDELQQFYTELHKAERDMKGIAGEHIRNEFIPHGDSHATINELVHERMEAEAKLKEAKERKQSIDKALKGYMTLNSYTKVPVDGYNVNFKKRFMVTKSDKNLGAL